MQESLKEKTAKGLAWGFINNGIQQCLGLLFGVVLGQILYPEDYGRIGVLLIFSCISSVLQESGFIAGITQKECITEQDLSAVFWFNILCGGFLYCLLFFAAPFIASFLKMPELSLLARVFFLGFLVSSFGIVPRAILFRELKTKENAIIGISSLTLGGGIGIFLAYRGANYWSLAVQTLTFCFSVTVLSWYFAKWKPLPKIDFTPLRTFWKFSVKILITDICLQMNNHLLSFILGRYTNKVSVGYYAQGMKWASMGSQVINGMVQGVAQPTFARIQEERDRMNRAFLKLLRFTAFISFPLLLGLASVSEELIGIVFPNRWLPVVPMMQILCVGASFLPIQTLYAQFIIAHGRSNIYMRNILIWAVLQLILILYFLSFGIKTMLIANVILNITYLFMWHFSAYSLSKLSLWQSLKQVLPFGGIAVFSISIACIISAYISPLFLKMSCKIVVVALIYLGILWFSKAKILRESLQYLRTHKS